jgi:hypothetical protein
VLSKVGAFLMKVTLGGRDTLYQRVLFHCEVHGGNGQQENLDLGIFPAGTENVGDAGRMDARQPQTRQQG